MTKAFGTNFVIVNDVVQKLNPKYFGGGNFIHLATVIRGFKEYMAYRVENTNQVYIEEIDPKDPKLFRKIQDDSEWQDLALFLRDAKLLEIGSRREIKSAYLELPGAHNVNKKGSSS